MAVLDSVKDIKPTQWALIAGAGLGLGLLLRMRHKATAATSVGTTDTPNTINDTQGYGNFSGTGQTGWAGGAIIDPNQPSDVGSTPVDVTPTSPVATGPFMSLDGKSYPTKGEADAASRTFRDAGIEDYKRRKAMPVVTVPSDYGRTTKQPGTPGYVDEYGYEW